MKKDWDILYESAARQLKYIDIPPFLKSGHNACCVLASSNNAYVGVSIECNSSLNSCAEQNAIIAMLNNGEHEIKKLVILNELEELITPCSSCVENLLELSTKDEELEILIDLKEYKTVKLSELLPDWWGTYKQKKK